MSKTKVSLVELFKGVPMFAKILDVLESQRFETIPEPRPAGYIIIGMMSPLERACATVIQDAHTKITALGDCGRGHPGAGCLSNILVEMEICPFAKSILAIKAECAHEGMIRDFMFMLISQRMLTTNPDLHDVALAHNFMILTSTAMKVPETIEMFEGFEKLSLEETLAMSIKGTMLESIITIAEAGEFIDEKTPVADGEVVIRDMTVMEKAAWTVYSHLLDSGKKLSEEGETLQKGDSFDCFGTVITISMGPDENSGVEGLYIPKDENHPDVIRFNQITEELDALKSKTQPWDELIWNMIASGIPQPQLEKYSTRGIRQGFKIVVYNER